MNLWRRTVNLRRPESARNEGSAARTRRTPGQIKEEPPTWALELSERKRGDARSALWVPGSNRRTQAGWGAHGAGRDVCTWSALHQIHWGDQEVPSAAVPPLYVVACTGYGARRTHLASGPSPRRCRPPASARRNHSIRLLNPDAPSRSSSISLLRLSPTEDFRTRCSQEERQPLQLSLDSHLSETVGTQLQKRARVKATTLRPGYPLLQNGTPPLCNTHSVCDHYLHRGGELFSPCVSSSSVHFAAGSERQDILNLWNF